MTTNAKGLIAAGCMIAFALVMALLHFLMTGINDQFGWGFGVGLIMGGGLVILASRNARHVA